MNADRIERCSKEVTLSVPKALRGAALNVALQEGLEGMPKLKELMASGTQLDMRVTEVKTDKRIPANVLITVRVEVAPKKEPEDGDDS